MDASIAPAALRQTLRSDQRPLVIDVRKAPAYLAAPDMMRGALRRDPARVAEWSASLPAASGVVVYCVHGHEVSQGAAQALRAAGIDAAYVEGGIENWRSAGGELMQKPEGAPTRWITRERPKIDRIACPWLIRRFIDADAEFLYVPAPDVRRAAQENSATPYDVPDTEFSHVGGRCSFDALLFRYHLAEPALQQLALIVRGADTNRPELAPQSAGLVAISLGLSGIFADDHEMLAHGMTVYDALYAWCRSEKTEVHSWNPAMSR
ncbi:MAG: chromate resistance protein [Proteobacteria bacterium]|nr:chromate resistance protein [Pseudomonadota bacterium]